MSLPRRCPNLGGEIRTKPVNRKRAIHTLVAVKYVLPAEARPPSQNFALDVYTAQFFGSDINYDYWGAGPTRPAAQRCRDGMERRSSSLSRSGMYRIGCRDCIGCSRSGRGSHPRKH